MNDAALAQFRALADCYLTLNGVPADWQWIGPHISQRMFGITEQRARDYATRHGGTATQMKE